MARTACSAPPSSRHLAKHPILTSDRANGGPPLAIPAPSAANVNTIASAAHNLSLDELAAQLGGLGPLEEQEGYCYVIRTVRLRNGVLVQTASAPNFDGGYITLCTCKHSMRATMPVEAWRRGVWIAGVNRWDKESKKQQGLVYLMRVGEAYESHFELVHALQSSGRTVTLEAKASTANFCGDIMVPRSMHLPSSEHRAVSGYEVPMLGHAHRKNLADAGWEDDVTYASKEGVPASLLVGDPKFSFTWSRQMVRNKKPGSLRPYRKWDLGTLLSNLEDFPA